MYHHHKTAKERRKFIIGTMLGATSLKLTLCGSKDSGAAHEAGQARTFTSPAYRSQKLTPDIPSKQDGEKIVLAQIEAGGRGINLALQVGTLRVNAEFKYICDVDDTGESSVAGALPRQKVFEICGKKVEQY